MKGFTTFVVVLGSMAILSAAIAAIALVLGLGSQTAASAAMVRILSVLGIAAATGLMLLGLLNIFNKRRAK